MFLRRQGLCGRITDGQACVLERYHDDRAHENGWVVVRRAVRSAYDLDERDPADVVFDVQRATHPLSMMFTTTNREHADWLASTLTQLDL
jgi:hypothetical protein